MSSIFSSSKAKQNMGLSNRKATDPLQFVASLDKSFAVVKQSKDKLVLKPAMNPEQLKRKLSI